MELACLTGLLQLKTLKKFKRRLDTYWHNQEIIYDFRAQLQGTGSRSKVSSYMSSNLIY